MRESLCAELRYYETHYPSGFAIVMAESPSETQTHLKGLPSEYYMGFGRTRLIAIVS